MAKNAVAEHKPDAIIPFSQTGGFVPTEAVKNHGMESLDKDDIKTPRIILLQGLSPQLGTYPTARKDQFWHTGMNVSLGKEFMFVPLLANKRVILFRPRNDQGGGILAFSKNGKTWDTGANHQFKVMLKGNKEPVIWDTKSNVLSSRLCEFGSSNPDMFNSQPAASLVYEYLVYLPDRPELSPCVLGLSKTAVPNGKSFNTSLMTIVKAGRPIYNVGVRAFTESKKNNDGEWTVPNFELMGWTSQSLYETTKKLVEQYSDYNVDYTQETDSQVDDEIAY